MPRGQKNSELGQRRAQAILDLLASGPMSRQQLSKALAAAGSSIAMHLERLHDDKRIHICGHIPNHMGMPATLWGIGNLPDVEYVPQSRPVPKTSAAERCEQVFQALAQQPRTSQQLAEAIHVVKKTASVYIAQLRRDKRLYILKWLAPGIAYPDARASSWVPVYAVGNHKDAPTPKRETRAARHARLSKDRDFREAERRRARVDYLVKKAKKKKQNIFSALGL